ncbi:hypothetical protein ACFXGX_03400, partial [Streptomyces sp. NPDC059371]
MVAEPDPTTRKPKRPGIVPGARHRVRTALRRLTGHPRPAALIRRLAPRSVRTRTTLAACASVAVVLLATSAVVLLLLRGNLERTVETGGRAQARDVARLAAAGRLPRPVTLGPGTDFIQVVDAHGKIVAQSQNLTGRPALTPTGTRNGHRTYNLDALGEEHHQRVTTVTTTSPTGPVTIHVGASLRTADAAEDITTAALAALSALLISTVGVLTWRTTRRGGGAGGGHPPPVAPPRRPPPGSPGAPPPPRPERGRR